MSALLPELLRLASIIVHPSPFFPHTSLPEWDRCRVTLSTRLIRSLHTFLVS